MAVSARLKKLAIAGVAALGVTGAFNVASQAKGPGIMERPQVSAPIMLTQTAPTLSAAARQALSADIIKQVKALDDFFANQGNLSMTAQQLQDIGNKTLDKVLELLRKGADPNYIDPQTQMSTFAWTLWMAYEMDRVDVVEEFLRLGADPKQRRAGNAPIPQAEAAALRQIGQSPVAVTAGSKDISIMDHAVRALMESQGMYKSHIETAVKILQALERAGAGFDQLAAMKRPNVTGYEGYARSALGLAVMSDMGLVGKDKLARLIDLEPSLVKALRGQKEITRDFLLRHNAPLIDYPDALPGGPEPYDVVAGDTIDSLAKRFRHAMGAKSVIEARNQIVSFNNLKGSIKAGQKIMIPVPPEHQIGQTGFSPIAPLFGVAQRLMTEMKMDTVEDAFNALVAANNLRPGMDFTKILAPGTNISYTVKGESKPRTAVILSDDALRGLAVHLRETVDSHDHGSHAQGSKDVERIMADLAEINGFSLSDIQSGTLVLDQKKPLLVVFHNDNFHHMDTLVAPSTYDPEHKVALAVIEDSDYHGKRTLGVASNTAYALNRNVDLSRFYSWNENFFRYPGPTASTALRMMMNLAGTPLQDKIMFSFSMAMAIDYKDADRMRAARRSDDTNFEEIRRFLNEMETNKPIALIAAGNWRQEIQGKGDGDERYVQSYLITHSPRAVNIGAAGSYEMFGGGNKTTISPYSSFGGDKCSILPKFLGEQQEGTSFATPTAAAVMRQFLEWYGNKLTFEEIMAVGMMTGARDVLDFDPAGGQINGNKSVAGLFRTNGAGLPVHDRCAGGTMDRSTVAQWNELLKQMVEFKKTAKANPELRSHYLDFGTPTETRKDAQGKAEYVYRVTVPQNMTLGKLTFLLPQEMGKHSEVFVKTPSGFEIHMPKSHYDVVSTQAFNYEDVKAGSVIEIRTGEPLGKAAGMYLRGHDNGNTIQMMRDHLRTQGILKAPLQTMLGDKPITAEEERKIREQRKPVKKPSRELMILIPVPDAPGMGGPR